MAKIIKLSDYALRMRTPRKVKVKTPAPAMPDATVRLHDPLMAALVEDWREMEELRAENATLRRRLRAGRRSA